MNDKPDAAKDVNFEQFVNEAKHLLAEQKREKDRLLAENHRLLNENASLKLQIEEECWLHEDDDDDSDDDSGGIDDGGKNHHDRYDEEDASSVDWTTRRVNAWGGGRMDNYDYGGFPEY